MVLPFFKKKKEEVIIGKGFIPIDRVREMASRGFSEPEMIDVLRREGFSAEEIDRALTHVLRAGISEPKTRTETALPTLEEIVKPETPKAEVSVPETSLPPEYYASYATEEYIDYVVQSRISEVNERLNEFNIKYEEIEKRIEQINEQLNEIIKARTSEQQLILNRIESFSDAINDANIRVSSLEKAFKETLPALIESVRALSDLVQRLKKEA